MACKILQLDVLTNFSRELSPGLVATKISDYVIIKDKTGYFGLGFLCCFFELFCVIMCNNYAFVLFF